MQLQDGILGGFPMCTHMKESGGWEGGCPPPPDLCQSFLMMEQLPTEPQMMGSHQAANRSATGEAEPRVRMMSQNSFLINLRVWELRSPNHQMTVFGAPSMFFSMYTSFLQTRHRSSSFLNCPKQFGSDHRLTLQNRSPEIMAPPSLRWNSRNAFITKACPSHFLLFGFFVVFFLVSRLFFQV